MPRAPSPPAEVPAPSRRGVAIWAAVAAFGTYFCMYAFRKPFTAAAYSDEPLFGTSEKAVLVTAQVLGYLVSKIVGIKIISELPPQRRAVGLMLAAFVAEFAFLLFAVVPRPWHVVCLFLNGLPLGMVFGLVMGFLEGRRNTEALAAGLCASFVLGDGVTKSLGTWLLQSGVAERWMPSAAGALFSVPLAFFVWMLTRIPPPDAADVASRSERPPVQHVDRVAFLTRHAAAIVPLLLVFLLITITRSLRADFAPEIWKGLGSLQDSSTFARSESLVALGVLLANGLCILVHDNRRGFLTGIAVAMTGLSLLALALFGLHQQWLGGFAFMVLAGLGLYLPYVALHTTLFERLIAVTRDRSNIGFLLCLADSVGYLGYVGVILGRGWISQGQALGFFTMVCWVAAAVSAIALIITWRQFSGVRAELNERSAERTPTGRELVISTDE